MLAACDGSSRFVFCVSAPDTAAISAAQFIHDLSRQFGFPEAFWWKNSRQTENLLIARFVACDGSGEPSISAIQPTIQLEDLELD